MVKTENMKTFKRGDEAHKKEGRYTAVYNREREKLDISDMDEKIDTIRRKMSGNHSAGELKKSIGELWSFVRFTKDGVVLNERHIEMMRKLAGRFLIVTNTYLNDRDAVSAYKGAV